MPTATIPSIIPVGKTVGVGTLILTQGTDNPQEITCRFEGTDKELMAERRISLSTFEEAFDQNGTSVTEGDTEVKVHRIALNKVISFIIDGKMPVIIVVSPVRKFVMEALEIAGNATT